MMHTYVALLRAINVGGTGKLAMTELRALCEGCGFQDVATYIQSGNVVFRSPLPEAKAKRALEGALAKKLGKPVAVSLRTAAELQAIVADPPFPDAAPNHLLILFLDAAPPAESVQAVVPPGRERLLGRGREVFIHYPDGVGTSKLKLPFQHLGTTRNLNTARKLAELALALRSTAAKPRR